MQAKAKAEADGEEVPSEGMFDSNCITPGTPFMDRLSRHLKFFVRTKMARDPLWQKFSVILSGHDIPGEGEHKIMEFVRLQVRFSCFCLCHFFLSSLIHSVGKRHPQGGRAQDYGVYAPPGVNVLLFLYETDHPVG